MLYVSVTEAVLNQYRQSQDCVVRLFCFVEAGVDKRFDCGQRRFCFRA